jgi:hypothetical protein
MPEREIVEIRKSKEVPQSEIPESPKHPVRLRGGLADRNPSRSNDKDIGLDEFEIRRRKFFTV